VDEPKTTEKVDETEHYEIGYKDALRSLDLEKDRAYWKGVYNGAILVCILMIATSLYVAVTRGE
jgi:hypothetical protein